MAGMSYAHLDAARTIDYAVIHFYICFITYVPAKIVRIGGPIVNNAAHILTP